MSKKNLRKYELKGINNKYRFYRYEEGDYFSPHTDGSWQHTFVDRNLTTSSSPAHVDEDIDDSFRQWTVGEYDDRHSALTFLVLLTDDFMGGSTIFHEKNGKEKISLRTPKGGVLCFFHGMHPLHVLHEGEKVEKGVKYMIRTEVTYAI